jgi:hypothetical protein
MALAAEDDGRGEGVEGVEVYLAADMLSVSHNA